MKGEFNVEPKPLVSAVGFVAKWLEPRPADPIHAGILIQVADGFLTISGYNEDVSSRAFLDVQGNATGAVVVSGRLLAALVDTFPDRPVRVSAAGRSLRMQAGRVIVTLPIMGNSEYPTLPAEPDRWATVESVALARAVNRVAQAAPQNASDPGLVQWRPMRLDVVVGKLELLASDSRRAARAFVPATFHGESGGRAPLVPASLLAEATKAMAGYGTVRIGVSATLCSLTVQDRCLIIRQAAGPYKAREVQQAIAFRTTHAALIPRAEIQSAIKRVLLVQSKDFRGSTLLWQPGEVMVSTRGTEERAEAGESIDISYDGPECTIAVNSTYFAAALDGVGSPKVEISFTPDKPFGILVFTDPDDPNYLHVLKPLRA